MALAKPKTQTPLGMQTLDFWPISNEPDGNHPVYSESVNLGAAVKGYLSITTAPISISGDNIVQVENEVFTGGQLDSETTMSDLEVNSVLFGHTYSEQDGEESKGTDRAKPGGLSFIEPILTNEKGTLYRATCLRKVYAMASSEKQEADTKKAGELSPKMNAVSFKVMEDNAHSWRVRNDFETVAAAEAFIKKTFGAAT